jgi:hypothetical protein
MEYVQILHHNINLNQCGYFILLISNQFVIDISSVFLQIVDIYEYMRYTVPYSIRQHPDVFLHHFSLFVYSRYLNFYLVLLIVLKV